MPLLLVLLLLLPAISQAEGLRSRSASLQVSFQVLPSCSVNGVQADGITPLVVCNYAVAPTLSGASVTQLMPSPAKVLSDASGVTTIRYELPS